MPCGYMADFVRHDAGQFSFVVRLQNHPEFTKKNPPGSANALTSRRLDYLNGERNLGVRVPDQVLSHPVDVLGDGWIVDDLGLSLNLLGQLLANAISLSRE